ncbi:MAG: multidrug effflux MFS transporter [Pseudomonadales bacterium]|nr:multidrug effflux MFS transporter [Pseudomonadales bacterium]
MALGPLAIDMYLPAFPAIETQLGHGAQLTLSGFFLGLVIGQLIYGPVSDHVGRRAPLLFGVGVYVLASLACSFSTSMHQLIALRFMQALGACSCMVISRAIVRDRCHARAAAQAQSRLMLVMGAAPILAPSLGSFLLRHFSWQGIFILQALAASLALFAAWWALEETHPLAKRQHTPNWHEVPSVFLALLRERRFMGFALSSTLVMAGMFAYITGSPYLLMQVLGVSPQHYALIFSTNAGAFILSSQLNAYWLRRYDMTVLLNRAIHLPVLTGIAMIVITWAGNHSLYGLLGLLFLYMGSLGFIVPNAVAAALATQGSQRAGTAASLMGAMQFGLATLVSSVMASWHRQDAIPVVCMMGLCALLAWGTNCWLLRPHFPRLSRET